MPVKSIKLCIQPKHEQIYMESRQYYILDKSQKKGPFSIHDLSGNVITHHTKVWYPGLSKWQKASSIPELQSILEKLPPPSHYKRNILIAGTVAFIAITMCLAWSKDVFKLTGKNSAKASVEQAFNNQQLYNLYAPGIVLIQHKYIYEITAGSKKFYFNDYWYYDSFCYLTGLTEDRAQAEDAASPIQGTGFFVSKDGKILTNRHVAIGNPGNADQSYIRSAFLANLTSSQDQKLIIDSLQTSKAQYDSTLTGLLEDSTNNAIQIAELKQKLVEIQDILDAESANSEEADIVHLDAETIDVIRKSDIAIHKITLDLKVFTDGAKDLERDGIKCNIIATSTDQNVDLALIQTESHNLPDTSIKLPKLSRLRYDDADSMKPKMSEKLILIGYNMGTGLSVTTDGIKSQLTEGKVSQNTDSYKLMYTIPTLEGSSGSPVFDDRGRLVSVNFAGVNQTQSFNYGIHPKKIQEFLKKYLVI